MDHGLLVDDYFGCYSFSWEEKNTQEDGEYPKQCAFSLKLEFKLLLSSMWDKWIRERERLEN